MGFWLAGDRGEQGDKGAKGYGLPGYTGDQGRNGKLLKIQIEYPHQGCTSLSRLFLAESVPELKKKVMIFLSTDSETFF